MKPDSLGFDFTVDVDGQMLGARTGDTVAVVLLRSGILTFRSTLSGRPRGVFCGMGICFDCLVTIDDLPQQRACVTLARPGMRVSLQPVTAEKTKSG